ncbi:MAG TPA: site-specific integrase, partial [Gammaproteobacteria bacterium]
MATIRSRGPYQWQAIIRRRGYPVSTRTFELKAEAESWARAVESEMDRGVFLDRSLAEKTSVGELLEDYERDVTSTKRGKYAEKSHLAAIAGHRISKYSAAAVDGRVVSTFRDDQLKAGLAPATVMRRLMLLSHVFAIAAKEWGIHMPHGNPVALVKKPRVKNERNRRLREGEEEELLRRASAYGGNLREIIVVALETAMRRGEIASMRWDQVDLKKRTVHL